MMRSRKKTISRLFIITAIVMMISVASQKPASAADGEFPTMSVMSRAEFDRQLMDMGSAINEKNGISDDEIAAERGTYAASYDPRSLGKVSAIREQVGGTCWVYSAIAMTEMNLIKKGYENSSVDLSEFHALYFNNQRHSRVHLTTAMADGGTEAKIIDDMIDGVGPVYESTVPFPAVDKYSDYDNIKLDVALMYQHIYEPHRWDGEKINSTADGINAGKRLITEYGAFMLGMYHNADYLNYASDAASDMTYYMPKDVYYTNHALVVVGWDDNYPASNFKNTPPGNGAWLAKQSYGNAAETGRRYKGTGFMWISYYDGSIDGGVAACEFTKPGVTAKTITLLPSDQTLERGGATATISAAVYPASAQSKELVWSSSDESIATVSQTGVVTPVGKGTCEITAKAKVGFAEAKCSVTVTAPLKGIQISTDEISVFEGDKFVLYNKGAIVRRIPSDTPDRLFYSSSDPSVLEIVSGSDINTNFRANKEGISVVTISSEDGTIRNSLTVKVLPYAVLDIKPVGFGSTYTVCDTGENLVRKRIVLHYKVSATDEQAVDKISYDRQALGDVFYSPTTKIEAGSDGTYDYYVYLAIHTVGRVELILRADDNYHKESRVTIEIKRKETPSTQPSVSPSQTPNAPATDCSTGHSYNQDVKKATSSADGYVQKRCTRCGHVTDKKVIRKVNQIFVEDVVYNGKKQYPSVKIYDSKNKNLTSKCSICYSSNKSVGTASVTATYKNSEYDVSISALFNIVPKGTVLKSVTRNGNEMTVKWKKQSKADGYELAYSSKKSFSKATTKTMKVKGSSSVSKTINKLTKKTYYVKIRTYKTVGKKKYYSSWSKVVKAK